jgi:hypothetical protein
MQDEYCAILSNGKHIRSNTWDNLQYAIKDLGGNVKVYIAKYYDTPPHITRYNNSHYWPHFQILDKNGNARPYKRGNFKVINIYPDEGSYYFKHRRVTIFDYVAKEIKEVHMQEECSSGIMFYNALITLLTKLELERSS